MRKNRTLLQSIIDNANTEISLKDPKAGYLLINKQFEQAYNVDRTTALGKRDDDLFEPALAHSLSDDLSLETEQTLTIGGKKRFLLSSTFPLNDKSNKNC